MSNDGFSEALVYRNDDGTATIEWTYRADSKQVLMSEELFIECVQKHSENVRLREALRALCDATDGALKIVALPAIRKLLIDARAVAVSVLQGEPQ